MRTFQERVDELRAVALKRGKWRMQSGTLARYSRAEGMRLFVSPTIGDVPGRFRAWWRYTGDDTSHAPVRVDAGTFDTPEEAIDALERSLVDRKERTRQYLASEQSRRDVRRATRGTR